MTLQLTTTAAQRIRDQLAVRGKGVGLRLGVKPTGCNGYSYVMDYADEVHADDQVFEAHGSKLVVDTESLGLLDGSTLDYVREGLNQRFRVNNPRVKDQCGCGDSFSLS